MFNVTIVKIKDLIKYIFIITIAIIAIVFLLIITAKRNFIETLSKTVPTVFKEEAKEKKEVKSETDYLKDIIKEEISSIGEEEKSIETTQEVEVVEEQKTQEEEKKETTAEIQTDIPTEVVTQNPIQEKFNVQYGNVKIKNETEYALTETMMTPDITLENKNILIFHTHTCESYTSSESYPYTPTGSYRTSDLNFTVSRVGTELETYLKQFGYNVYHDTTYHDYPAYNGSYTRSLNTVSNILKTNPSDIVIDLHRDAIGSRSDYAPTVKIGEDYAAQIMFVIGTDNGGLEHPNWNQNLKFAIKVQQKAEEMYPGLFKPIMLTKSRYNQHTTKYANIMEVGATGNTLEQCLTSMKYLSKVMDEILK